MSHLSARPPIPSLSALDGMQCGKTGGSEDLELTLWDVALPGQLHIDLQWDWLHSWFRFGFGDNFLADGGTLVASFVLVLM